MNRLFLCACLVAVASAANIRGLEAPDVPAPTGAAATGGGAAAAAVGGDPAAASAVAASQPLHHHPSRTTLTSHALAPVRA